MSCPYRWATRVIIVSNTHALPAEYKCFQSNKTGAIHFTNVCWVSVLTTFLRRHKFCCIDSFLLPNSRNEEMMGDGFLGATAAGLF